jgi:hypothetical protein
VTVRVPEDRDRWHNQVVGTNDISQQVDYTGRILVNPTGDFSFITDADDFSTLQIEAEVQKDTAGDFGVFTVRDTAVMS